MEQKIEQNNRKTNGQRRALQAIPGAEANNAAIVANNNNGANGVPNGVPGANGVPGVPNAVAGVNPGVNPAAVDTQKLKV